MGGSLRVVQQVGFDAPLSELLLRELGCAGVCFAQTEESAAAVLEAYGTSALVVSNRLHALLFGWACGAVPLAVVDGGHDAKIAGVFRQVGLEDLLLPVSRIADLPEVAMSLVARRDEWRRRLQPLFAAERERLRLIFAAEAWRGAQAPGSP
jgi:polysaccharide pyruvyl transferase WcaK-like protein